MIKQSDKKRFAAGSWFVGLALAFALSFGFTGQAFADDQASEAVFSDSVVSGVVEDDGENAGSIESGFLDNQVPESQPTNIAEANDALDNANGAPTTIKGTSGISSFDGDNRDNTSPFTNDAKEIAGHFEDSGTMTGFSGAYDVAPGFTPIGSTTGSFASNETAINGLSENVGAGAPAEGDEQTGDSPAQTDEASDAYNPDYDAASATADENAADKVSDAEQADAAEKTSDADKAKAKSKASKEQNGNASKGAVIDDAQGFVPWNCAAEYDSAYEQAASEAQAASEPQEQPKEAESIKAVRWSGGSSPDVPVLSEASNNRVGGSSSSSQFAITPEEGLSSLAGSSSLSNYVQNRQGALLFSKARCRSP